MPFQLIRLKAVDSTNNYLKALVSQGLSVNTAVTADIQTAGRGRQGKDFCSPEGGVYLSVLLSLGELAPRELMLVTPTVAVRAVHAITTACGKSGALIKWVNDIFLNDRKVCGILTERVMPSGDFGGGVIVGIGINTSGTVLPEPLCDTAGCVSSDRETLVAALLKELDLTRNDIGTPEVIREYRALSYLDGKSVTFTRNSTDFAGTVIGIDEECKLVVETTDGLLRLDCGEVSVKRKL